MARTPSVSDEEILEAARRVIGRLGPNAFTVTDVASEVGLSRAAIILRFKSTHALKVLLLNRMVDQFIEMLAQLPKTPSGDNLLIVAAFIGERASNIDERARKRGPLPSFFASYPANMEDPDLAALERRRGEALRVAVSRVMPMTTIGTESGRYGILCSHDRLHHGQPCSRRHRLACIPGIADQGLAPPGGHSLCRKRKCHREFIAARIGQSCFDRAKAPQAAFVQKVVAREASLPAAIDPVTVQMETVLCT